MLNITYSKGYNTASILHAKDNLELIKSVALVQTANNHTVEVRRSALTTCIVDQLLHRISVSE